MKNILVTTLGTSSAIVPELFAFTNPEDFPLFECSSAAEEIAALREQFVVCPVDEVWVVTTAGTRGTAALFDWMGAVNDAVVLRMWCPYGVDKLDSFVQCRCMADLTLRVVLHARKQVAGGRLFLSLAGGRKTMSADMQEAAHFFGCNALLHVASGNNPPSFDDLCNLSQLESAKVAAVHPLVIAGAIVPSPLVDVEPALCVQDYPLETVSSDYPLDKKVVVVAVDNLYYEVKRRIADARNLLFNFVEHLLGDEEQTGFRALYSLPPHIIKWLHSSRVGSDVASCKADMEWLRCLPKAELHCHLGGILSPAEMVEVATEVLASVDNGDLSDELSVWLHTARKLIAGGDLNGLRCLLDNPKQLRKSFSGVKQPLAVAAFLSLFAGSEELLARLIFADLVNDSHYCGIGIERYEQLGDLQGSGLLQCEAALRTACRVLKRQVEQQNIFYLELRCSPENYTAGGLSSRQVVDVLLDELAGDGQCQFMLIFIASRHGGRERIRSHIALTTDLLNTEPRFVEHFAGFDLAGAESKLNPAQLRDEFMPLLQRCVNITIHAGENEDVNNIWEAVYHLSADRIGHGLTLGHNKRLLSRFLDRKIALEMCPSSNFQIVGFKHAFYETTQNLPEYPLREFLQAGLRVCVNSDNPGISQTDLTAEYYRAATLSQDGLTRWEVLQLVRNSFRSVFCTFPQRRKLLLRAERCLIDLLQKVEL